MFTSPSCQDAPCLARTHCPKSYQRWPRGGQLALQRAKHTAVLTKPCHHVAWQSPLLTLTLTCFSSLCGGVLRCPYHAIQPDQSLKAACGTFHTQPESTRLPNRLLPIPLSLEAIAIRLESFAIRFEAIAIVGWRPLLLGWRPSLLGWRPSLLGWRPSLLGWRPPLLGWRLWLLGWRPMLLGWRPLLLGWSPLLLGSRPSL